ncbi:MAG: GIY-YIG nuclease family protein [Bacteroidetes bacterium]|nr:GIY-YIG nuclease family protein [Bacteroidota bacterium]
MASLSKRTYVGVTADLFRRVYEHKFGEEESFTHRYHINKLVYYETFNDIRDAISRETQIKDYRREKKVVLIEGMNRQWADLAHGWYPKGSAFTDSSLRSE